MLDFERFMDDENKSIPLLYEVLHESLAEDPTEEYDSKEYHDPIAAYLSDNLHYIVRRFVDKALRLSNTVHRRVVTNASRNQLNPIASGSDEADVLDESASEIEADSVSPEPPSKEELTDAQLSMISQLRSQGYKVHLERELTHAQLSVISQLRSQGYIVHLKRDPRDAINTLPSDTATLVCRLVSGDELTGAQASAIKSLIQQGHVSFVAKEIDPQVDPKERETFNYFATWGYSGSGR